MDWLRKLIGGSSGGGSPEANRGDPAPLLVVWRPGSYPMEVVDESYYQPSLVRLYGGGRKSRVVE